MSSNLPSNDITYPDDAAIFETVVSKNLFALNDEEGIQQDLRIGATGGVNVRVGATGKVKVAVSGEDALSIEQKSDIDNTTVIRAEEDRKIEIRAGDVNNTVTVSGFEMRSEVTEKSDVIKSKHDYTSLNTDTLYVTGSTHVEGDIIANNSITGESLNVVRDLNGKRIGYGFSINDNEQLALYKYDSSTDKLKTVSVFGDGVVNAGASSQDHYTNHAFPDFVDRNSVHSVNNAFSIRNVGESASNIAASGQGNFWTIDNATKNVFFTDGNVGIGKSDPGVLLDVSGDVRVEGSVIGNSVRVGGAVGGGGYQFDVSGSTRLLGTTYFKTLASENNGVNITGNNVTNLSAIVPKDGSVVVSGSVSVAGSVSTDSIVVSKISDGRGVDIEGGVVKANKVMDGSGASMEGGVITANRFTDGSGVVIENGVINATRITDGSGAVIENGDIVASGDLTVNGLSTVGGVITLSKDMIPFDSNINIGTETNRFHTIYSVDAKVSSNTLYIGDVSISEIVESGLNKLQVNTSLQVEGSLKKNGEELHSTPNPSSGKNGDLVSVYNGKYIYGSFLPQDSLSDFTNVAGPEGTSDVTEYIKGTVHYDKDHDWTNKNWNWCVISSENEVLGCKGDGSSIDISGSNITIIKEGANNNDVNIPLVKDDGEYIEKSMYLITKGDIGPLHALPLTSYIPSSVEFKRKAMSDFNTCYNELELRHNVRILNRYVHMPENTNQKIHSNQTKDFIVVFMATNELPVMNSENIILKRDLCLAPSSPQNRMDSVYVFNTDTDSYELETNSEDGSMAYPFCKFMKWTNSYNTCKFVPTIYKSYIGWGGSTNPTTQGVYDAMASYEGDWLRELYKRTYLFIRYGSTTNMSDSSYPLKDDVDWANIDQYYEAYCESVPGYNLRFQSTTIMNRSVNNKVMFKKGAFPYI